MQKEHIWYLYDAKNTLCGVQLSAALWKKVETSVLRTLSEGKEVAAEQPIEPLDDFAQFLEFWDFHYPYNPAVSCPHCGAKTEDWRNDAEHPFYLTTANLGGLLVFRCRHCQSTVRQKHFRDHVAYECTPYIP